MTLHDDTRHPELATEDDRIPNRPVLMVLGVTMGLVILFAALVSRLLLAEETALLGRRVVVPPMDLSSEVSQVERNLLEPAGPQWSRDAQRRELETYRWVDRRQGIVDIPIERAMDLLVREGGEKGKGAP